MSAETLLGIGIFGGVILLFLVVFYFGAKLRPGRQTAEPSLLTANPDLQSPGGMRVVCSVGSEQRLKLPKATDEWKIIPVKSFFGLCKFRLYKCGHEGLAKFMINAGGDLTKVIDDAEHCPACFSKILKSGSIRCGICGLPIFPGQAVALYADAGEGINRRYATVVNDDCVIGCMRRDCCPTGGYFAGYWTGEAFQPAFPEGTAIDHAMATGSTVIGNT